MELHRSSRRSRLTTHQLFRRTTTDNDDDDGGGGGDSTQEEEEEGESSEWSGLTDHLLLSILQRLTTLQDFSAFRAVCRNWHSISSPSPLSTSSQSPLLFLTLPHSPSHSAAFFDLALRRLYLTPIPPWSADTRRTLSYSHGHLITSTRGPVQKPLLWNLFTFQITRLPKTPVRFHQLLLSSPLSSPDCLVLLLDKSRSSLQFCRPGDRRWILHGLGYRKIRDFVFFKGLLYAVTATGQLGLFNLVPHPKLVLLEGDNVIKAARGVEWILGESGGQLLLVCMRRASDWDHKFEIWGWDFEGSGGWVKVDTLEERALFINHSSSAYLQFAASVDSSAVPGVRGNCIYYTASERGNEWTVYCLEDRMACKVDPSSTPSLPRGRTVEAPVWVFPSIC